MTRRVNHDLVDLDLVYLGESEKAYKVQYWSADGGETIVWLPKSQVERDGDCFTLPEWLAEEKGLI